MVKIRVPATTANIGPGFDCFGCALQLYNTFTFEKADDFRITGCPEEYAGRENLCYQAYAAVCAELGVNAENIHIHIESDIPVTRGLGSSATCLAAGAMGANELHNGGLTREQMLTSVTPLEGHPDNLAPALLGGLTAAMMHGGEAVAVRFPVHESLCFYALIPPFELSTSAARGVLPAEIPFKDAVYNISHAAVLLRALETGDGELIGKSLRDRLHQPYRRTLIEGYDSIELASLDAGAYSVCISGAGPTMLALADDAFGDRLEASKSMPEDWIVLKLPVDTAGATVV